MINKIKAGRPKINTSNHKKNRAISLTDKEYEELKRQASLANLGVSAFILKTFKLSKT